jgi:hypothetical protein
MYNKQYWEGAIMEVKFDLTKEDYINSNLNNLTIAFAVVSIYRVISFDRRLKKRVTKLINEMIDK